MKNTKKQNLESEEKVRLACGIFLAMFLVSLFVGVFNLEEDSMNLGILFLVFAFIFLGITLYAYFNPFISTVIGLALYTILVAWLFIAFPDTYLKKGLIYRFGQYIIIGFILIFAALKDSYKNRKVRN